MKTKFCSTWLLMLLFAMPAWALQINGVVIDKATSEPIIGASVLE